MMRPPGRWATALLAAALPLLAPGAATTTAAAEQGVSSGRVLFGQSAAFSGPAGELGRNMRLGIQAAFAEINERGGVHGRRLELTSLDDAYEPEAAIANTAILANREKVFALIGAVGTPTSRSAVPVATSAGVPFVAPFTGAEFLRDPKLRLVVNMRASYYQETEEMVARLIGDRGIDRIAVLYQDDTFGRDGYQGVLRALERRGLKPVGTGVYPRNTTAVKTALLDLRSANPGAVVLVGAYRPVAAFIAWARHIGFDPVFMTVSFVGSNALRRELGPTGAGVYVAQVVPFPTGNRLPVLASYRRALARHGNGTQPGFVSLEGYLAARLAIAALQDCGAQPDRACFLTRLRTPKEIDIGGFKLRYDANDNQGSDRVFLTVIGNDGRYRAVDTLRDPAAR